MRWRDVLGRLPTRHRLTIWIAGILTFAGGGAWLAVATDRPLMWLSDALVGALLGAVVVAGFLQLLERAPTQQPARARNVARR